MLVVPFLLVLDCLMKNKVDIYFCIVLLSTFPFYIYVSVCMCICIIYIYSMYVYVDRL